MALLTVTAAISLAASSAAQTHASETRHRSLLMIEKIKKKYRQVHYFIRNHPPLAELDRRSALFSGLQRGLLRQQSGQLWPASPAICAGLQRRAYGLN